MIASTLEVDDQLTTQQCIAKNEAVRIWNGLTIQEAENIFEKCKTEKKQKFLKEHCAEISGSYAPLGLIGHVAFLDELKTICDVPEANEEIPSVTINPNLPTVMMVGESGEGKSYLGNALYGEKNGDFGPFTVGQSVTGKYKQLFGSFLVLFCSIKQ